MAQPILTIEEVREFLQDRPENNLLLDNKEEFPSSMISLAIELAVSAYNALPPMSTVTSTTFPNKAILLTGTLYKLYAGQAALLARNTMNYSDGGLQIPIEERFSLYQSLAAMYQADFENSARSLKMHLNVEEGWGYVFSEYSNFPTW